MRMLLPALMLALIGTTAQAADNGFYLGAGVTQAEVDDILDAGFDIDDTAWKVIAGFRPIDLIAIEATYMDLGSESRTVAGITGRADAKAFAAHGLVYAPIPVPFLGIYGKAGLARWDLDGDVNSNLVRFDRHGTEFAWGAGAQLNFGSFGARL